MKNVNQLVLTVQAEGNESFAWVELFETVMKETIEPKADSFQRQLKGDVQEGISEGYKLLMDLVGSWDGTGNFHSLFKTSYENRLKNLVKHIGRNKRKHNTSYDLSLSETIDSNFDGGNDMTVIDRVFDKALYTEFDITEKDTPSLYELLDAFAYNKPEQAGVINVMLGFDSDMKQSDKTNAYCEYFGVQTYTSAVQKKVSRAREAFKKFLTQNNYSLNF